MRNAYFDGRGFGKLVVFSLVFSLIFGVVSFSPLVQSVNAIEHGITFNWGGSVGSNQFERQGSVITDDFGNAFFTTQLRGTGDMDPGPGVFMMSAIGEIDTVVQKVDNDGNLVWAKQFGGRTTVETPDGPVDVGTQVVGSRHRIASDSEGAVYIVGEFGYPTDFDPNAGEYMLTPPEEAPDCTGCEDGFIVKLDANGNLAWAYGIGGLRRDNARGVTIDSQDNVIISGSFSTVVDFDPGPGVFEVNSSNPPDVEDSYVLKLDNDGNFSWVTTFEGSLPQFVSVDGADNSYISRSLAGGSVIEKINSSGDLVWRVQYTNNVSFTAMDVSATGNFHGVGVFPNGVLTDVDPGPGEVLYQNPGEFVIKFDTNGNYVWSTDYYPTTGEPGIALDGGENVYFTGMFGGSFDFDPGPSELILGNSSTLNASVVKLNVDGEFANAATIENTTPHFSGGTEVRGTGIDVNANNEVVVEGLYIGTIDVDPSEGVKNVTSQDIRVRYDIFEVSFNMGPRPPSGPQASDFVALGHEGVFLKSGVIVHSGDVAANQAASGPFLDSGSEMIIGNNVTATNAETDIYGDSLQLKSGSQVNDVHYNEKDGTGIILGTETTPITFPIVASLPTVPAVFPSPPDITIPASTSQNLAAGSYNNLTVNAGATVILTGGVYEFRNWDIRTNANVFFTAATEVRIAEKLNTNAGADVRPQTGASIDASDVKIFVNGINGNGGAIGNNPKAADFGMNNVVQANIYASNGTLEFASGVNAAGAFLGKWVVVGNNGELTLDSAF